MESYSINSKSGIGGKFGNGFLGGRGIPSGPYSRTIDFWLFFSILGYIISFVGGLGHFGGWIIWWFKGSLIEITWY